VGNLWGYLWTTCGGLSSGGPCGMSLKEALSKETVAVCVVLHGIPSFWGLFYDLYLILAACKVFLRPWLVLGREKPQIRPILTLDIATKTSEHLLRAVSPGIVGIFSVPTVGGCQTPGL